MAERTVVVLAGDGVGPEVVAEARACLAEVIEDLRFDPRPIGGCALDSGESPLPAETLDACRSADAVLLGSVGGPRWNEVAAERRPEQGLLALRRELGCWANLRPVRIPDALAARSPVREELVRGCDMLIVRELLGGIYFGEPRGETVTRQGRRAHDTMVYTDDEVRRIARIAFQLACERRRQVLSVDKANVLATSALWREVVVDVSAEFPDVTLEHMLVDACAFALPTRAREFDVVLTANLFGDILSDAAGALAGSLGLLPSASLGDAGVGIFEPIHGSAPDLAGHDRANPIGAILSAAMLARHGLGEEPAARRIEAAVDEVLAAGLITPDVGGTATTSEVGAAVRSILAGDARRGRERSSSTLPR
ncbi:MAG: 3-isopropylmalate dehydrogenase [Planctomycetes bacterium]|nr:3-isopropylmalate dehydrogenase [Planctomycetota bacterium]